MVWKIQLFPLVALQRLHPTKFTDLFIHRLHLERKMFLKAVVICYVFSTFSFFLLLLPLLLYKSFLTLGHVMYKYEPHTQRYKYSSFNHKFFRLRGFLFQNFTINCKGFFTIANSDFFECVQHIHEIQINHLVNDLDLKLELFKKRPQFSRWSETYYFHQK